MKKEIDMESCTDLKCYDGRLNHPFTCLVSGPTQAGKSTLLTDIIEKRKRLIDSDFAYIIIYLGTPPHLNAAYTNLRKKNPMLIELIDVNKRYPDKEAIKNYLSVDIKSTISKYNGRPGLMLFDDLMQELANSGGILTELFTKLSSHNNLSSIHITQNLFSKMGGNSTDHTTMYRNSKYIILFDSRLDSTVFSHVARRIAPPGKSKLVQDMLMDIVEKHRYVLISGGLNTPKELQFRSDITADYPTPHQLVFQLAE